MAKHSEILKILKSKESIEKTATDIYNDIKGKISDDREFEVDFKDMMYIDNSHIDKVLKSDKTLYAYHVTSIDYLISLIHYQKSNAAICTQLLLPKYKNSELNIFNSVNSFEALVEAIVLIHGKPVIGSYDDLYSAADPDTGNRWININNLNLDFKTDSQFKTNIIFNNLLKVIAKACKDINNKLSDIKDFKEKLIAARELWVNNKEYAQLARLTIKAFLERYTNFVLTTLIETKITSAHTKSFTSINEIILQNYSVDSIAIPLYGTFFYKTKQVIKLSYYFNNILKEHGNDKKNLLTIGNTIIDLVQSLQSNIKHPVCLIYPDSIDLSVLDTIDNIITWEDHKLPDEFKLVLLALKKAAISKNIKLGDILISDTEYSSITSTSIFNKNIQFLN